MPCAGCGRRWGEVDGLPDLVDEAAVWGTDRLLRVVYDRLGRLHDPALRYLLAPIDGFDEDAVRARIADALAERLRAPPRRLLDLGCGTGQELLRLAARFPDAALVGVDLSPGMLRLGARKLARAGVDAWLALADVHALPFPDDTFDGVVHVGAVNNWRDKRRALAELLRVARPGAPVVIVDEQLDPALRRSLVHRGLFRAMTWYDRRPQAPVALLPADAEAISVTQLTRYFYLLACTKRRPSGEERA
ncbi:MAG: class I SAM-dependent methyltransferase [Alphaproteobacteria bacterium]|nr:class I SAM-dependent methyltransferase [Alphaproteobacteria bacterium]